MAYDDLFDGYYLSNIGNMLSEVVEYTKEASLVAKIQEFFGVKIHYSQNFSYRDGIEKDSPSSASEIASKFEYDSKELNSDEFVAEKGKTNGYNTVERRCNNFEKFEEFSSKDKMERIRQNLDYTITNYFWYYLFLFGTELGDETFYSAFMTFGFWNLDAAVGRRVVLVWAIIMTTGQILKDVIRWPRPACPPVVRLQSRWSQEYGMPSTHAMIAISIPFGIVLFTMNRYIYSLYIGCSIAFLWCALICTSRLYLGMHTVLDIMAGLMLAIVLMIPLVPLVDTMDYFIFSNLWIVMILITISIMIIVYYPCSEKWTPTRGDTTMVVSVMAGIFLGSWLNYSTGAMSAPVVPPPYNFVLPPFNMLASILFRTTLGFFLVVVTKAVCKFLIYTIVCAILKVKSKDLMASENHSQNKIKVFVDLVYKYITCFTIGVNTVYFLPKIFTVIGIGRPSFYTEI